MAFSRSHVAGAFGLVLGSKNLGYSEQGFEWIINTAAITPISEDRYGMAVIDGIWNCIETMYIQFESLYFNQDVWESAILGSPWGGGVTVPAAGTLVKQGSLAGSLVMSRKTGNDPKVSYTFANVASVEPVSLLVSSRSLRRVPISFQVFPTVASNDDSTEPTWFASSAT